MNDKWPSSNWLSVLLCIIAFIFLIFTWTSLFNAAYNLISPQNSGFDVSTRVVGVSFSIIFIRWFIASVAILILALFLFGRKKGYSSLSYWINSIAVSIIIPHIVLWIYLMRAFN